jgi:hypothetical protein
MNRYEIRVVGHVDARWARALGAEKLRQLAEGDSVLIVSAVDRAAVYGLLARVRDAGLELVGFSRLPQRESDQATTKGRNLE